LARTNKRPALRCFGLTPIQCSFNVASAERLFDKHPEGRLSDPQKRMICKARLIGRRYPDVGEDRRLSKRRPNDIDEGLEDNEPNPPLSSPITPVKFEIYGEEMIEKRVKASGNSGRVYLPPDWVGHKVKIIRID
jgi:putative transposon-encoded protein